ncbi:HAD family hydrolase [Myceligenerans xiligouense]|uniref:HAD superfamily hydrolase (TIGR01509 family) n=1 Tax=Myceligenerans xiligouense TaxID=253184 RepID=A0A3N4YMH3_9MICO|nr:HAD family hydrolase [Myceligenerans xiligouense]RPF20514.1 hypothetical protein EDD34_1109 [Myceligenerans xiligouense]
MTRLTTDGAAILDLDRITGAIFDLDSVVTATAAAAARAWNRLFDVAAYPATVQLIRELRRYQVRTAIVSAGRHCEQLLAAAGVTQLFDALIEPRGADRPESPARPGQAAFLLAAQRLGIAPSHCAVVEDGLTGTRTTLQGFGTVIGIDRTGDEVSDLYSHGADMVVRTMTDVHLIDAAPRHRYP